LSKSKEGRSGIALAVVSGHVLPLPGRAKIGYPQESHGRARVYSWLHGAG
jgi:hypothetical protein